MSDIQEQIYLFSDKEMKHFYFSKTHHIKRGNRKILLATLNGVDAAKLFAQRNKEHEALRKSHAELVNATSRLVTEFSGWAHDETQQKALECGIKTLPNAQKLNEVMHG